jgi:hypothetical protein
LCASFALGAIARQIFDYAFSNLRELLEDEILEVRISVARVFERLSINDDGCQRIV